MAIPRFILYGCGDVLEFRLRIDGSGFIQPRGGWYWFILMGGYVGSALFGNIVFYLGVKSGRHARIGLFIIGLSMLATVFLWYGDFYTKVTMLVFGLLMWWLAYKKWIMSETLMFLGMASIFYIVESFESGLKTKTKYGGTGDIAKYAELFPLISAQGWMYIWLAIVFIITAFNIRMILKQDKKVEKKSV